VVAGVEILGRICQWCSTSDDAPHRPVSGTRGDHGVLVVVPPALFRQMALAVGEHFTVAARKPKGRPAWMSRTVSTTSCGRVAIGHVGSPTSLAVVGAGSEGRVRESIHPPTMTTSAHSATSASRRRLTCAPRFPVCSITPQGHSRPSERQGRHVAGCRNHGQRRTLDLLPRQCVRRPHPLHMTPVGAGRPDAASAWCGWGGPD
jgi:hypothetical protein